MEDTKHLRQRNPRSKTNHQINKIITLKPDGGVLIRSGQLDRPKSLAQIRQRHANTHVRLDVATNPDENVNHLIKAEAFFSQRRP